MAGGDVGGSASELASTVGGGPRASASPPEGRSALRSLALQGEFGPQEHQLTFLSLHY